MNFRSLKLKLHFAWFWILFLIFATLTQAPLARPQGSPFDAPAGQPFDGRSGEIRGTVYVDKGNQALTQLAVDVRSLSSGVTRTVLTDYDGHFELRGLPPGAYLISVAEPGYESASTMTQVNLLPCEVTLSLKPSGASLPRGSAYSVSVRELKIPTKAQDQYFQGLARLAKGDPAGSLSHFNKAAAAFPDYYEAYYHMGVAELRLNRRDKAMDAFQKSIDLSGGRYAHAQFAYGLLLCRQGKPREGERLIRQGLETDANAPEGHLFLAVSLLAQNRLDEAEKSVQEALLRKPQYADAYLALSDLHARRKNYQAQLRDLDMYLKLAGSAASNEYARQAREAVLRRLSESSASPSTAP